MSACSSFQAHAFLQSDICTSCHQPLSDHSSSPSSPSPSASASASAAAAADEPLTNVCATYTPHHYIENRCSTCGHPPSSHSSTSSLSVSIPPTTPVRSSHSSSSVVDPPTSPISNLHLSLQALNHSRDALSAAEANKLDRGEITQAEYNNNIYKIQVEYQRRESDLQLELSKNRGDSAPFDSENNPVYKPEYKPLPFSSVPPAIPAPPADPTFYSSDVSVRESVLPPPLQLRLAVRHLPHPWLMQLRALVALYKIEEDGAHVYQGQTEVSEEQGSAYYSTKIPLDNVQNNVKYVAKVYDCPDGPVPNTFPPNSYIGLAFFTLEPGRHVYPLVHPTDSTLDTQLNAEGAEMEIDTTAGSAPLTVFTPLINYLAPNLTVEYYTLSLATASPYVSVWYRPRPTATHRFLRAQGGSASGSGYVVTSDGLNEDDGEGEFLVFGYANTGAHGDVRKWQERNMGRKEIDRMYEGKESDDPNLLGRVSISFKSLLQSLDSSPLIFDSPRFQLTCKLNSRTPSLFPAPIPQPQALLQSFYAKVYAALRGGYHVVIFPAKSTTTLKLEERKAMDADTTAGNLVYAGKSVPISTIKEVVLGAENDAFGNAPNDSSFIIQTNDNTNLFLQAANSDERDYLLAGVKMYSDKHGLSFSISTKPLKKRVPEILRDESVKSSVPVPAAAGFVSPVKTPAASPLSPTTPASPAREGVDLSSVLQKLEKLFEQGRNFIRFTSSHAKPSYISLFLRKDSGPKPMVFLYWCRADTRAISPTRCIRADEIQGITLGKQTGVFRKQEAALAPSSHCFSIIANSQSLHLQAWSERDCDTWAFGLASLIKQYSRTRPKLWQTGQYVENGGRNELEALSESKEEDDGTKQIDLQDIPRLAGAQGLKCQVELTIKCSALPQHHGNYIVCVFDRDESNDKLTYVAQTEKCTKGPSPLFRKRFHLTYDSSAPRLLRFNIYDVPTGQSMMEDKDRIGSAVMGLREVVDGAGIDFIYKLSHELAAKQNDLIANNSSIIINCSQLSDATADGAKSPPTSPRVAAPHTNQETLQKLIALIQAGDLFQFYSPVHTSQFLVYKAAQAPGALYWYDPTSREESHDNVLHLNELSEIVVGRGASFPPHANQELCFSLISKHGKRVDAEARTAKQRDDWAYAIIGIVQTSNLKSVKITNL